MSKRPRFAFRTIHQGRVRIRGVVFRPDEHHRAYEGQLDGQRWLFGLYWGPPNYDRYDAKGWCSAFVALWGTKAAAKAQTEAEMDALPREPNVDADGRIHWEWWHADPAGDRP